MSARTGVAGRWRLLFAVVALVVGFAPVGGGRAAALSPISLLNRYQPVTVLYPDELFPPVAVDSFLGVAQLEQRLPDETWSPAVGQQPGILPTTDPSGCTSAAMSACWRLNSPGCVPLMGVESLPCYRDL